MELHCTLTIEAWHKLNMHFDCGYLELCNACIFGLVYIVLNVRDRTESKYPSIVFLSIYYKAMYLVLCSINYMYCCRRSDGNSTSAL